MVNLVVYFLHCTVPEHTDSVLNLNSTMSTVIVIVVEMQLL